MLKISEDQFESLRVAQLNRFEIEMAAHLRRLFPARTQAVGDADLQAAVHLGTAKARDHGFTLRGPVRLYLELMLLFGSHFDTDSQYPWAAQAMANREDGAPEMLRAQHLHRAAQEYRRSVAGPEDAQALAAAQNLLALSRRAGLEIAPADLDSTLLRLAHHVYPEKARHIGNDALSSIIREAITAAHRQDIQSTRAIALIGALMLSLGHGCFRDPLHRWIDESMHGGGDADRWAGLEHQAIERLVRVNDPATARNGAAR